MGNTGPKREICRKLGRTNRKGAVKSLFSQSCLSDAFFSDTIGKYRSLLFANHILSRLEFSLEGVAKIQPSFHKPVVIRSSSNNCTFIFMTVKMFPQQLIKPYILTVRVCWVVFYSIMDALLRNHDS